MRLIDVCSDVRIALHIRKPRTYRNLRYLSRIFAEIT